MPSGEELAEGIEGVLDGAKNVLTSAGTTLGSWFKTGLSTITGEDPSALIEDLNEFRSQVTAEAKALVQKGVSYLQDLDDVSSGGSQTNVSDHPSLLHDDITYLTDPDDANFVSFEPTDSAIAEMMSNEIVSAKRSALVPSVVEDERLFWKRLLFRLGPENPRASVSGNSEVVVVNPNVLLVNKNDDDDEDFVKWD